MFTHYTTYHQSVIMSLNLKYLFLAHIIFVVRCIVFGKSFKFELHRTSVMVGKLVEDAVDVEVLLVILPVLHERVLLFFGPLWIVYLGPFVVASVGRLLHLLSDVFPVWLFLFTSKLFEFVKFFVSPARFALWSVM